MCGRNVQDVVRESAETQLARELLVRRSQQYELSKDVADWLPLMKAYDNWLESIHLDRIFGPGRVRAIFTTTPKIDWSLRPKGAGVQHSSVGSCSVGSCSR